MEKDTGLRVLSDEEVDAVVKEVEEEKAAAEAAKRTGGAGTSGQ
jgi:20S proteasome subunit alpha 4